MQTLFVAVSTLALAGCSTTTSFAPPTVERYQRLTSGSLDDFCKRTATTETPATIEENVAGARGLIRNHLATYECAMRVAADGRQPFEIGAFLSLVGPAALVGLGEAGRKALFVGQTGNSIFTAGKNYYAPQEQATILRSAVDAIACIQSEASGINAYELTETAKQERTANPVTKSDEGKTTGAEVTVEQQYFDLVESRLTAVNGAVAQRLAQRGTFDAAGIAAQIRTHAQELEEAEEADPPATDEKSLAGLTTEAKALALTQKAQLDLNVLRPKLDLCVVRAKA